MRKFLTFFATLLFFASVTVFTLPMMQDGANTDLTLTEKVTIMANAEDGGGLPECPWVLKCNDPGTMCWYEHARNRFIIQGCKAKCNEICTLHEGDSIWPW